MSAYKTAVIRLGESEYQRLREAEEQLRLMELRQFDQGNSNSFDASIFDQIVGQSKERTREFQNVLSGLDQEVRKIEKENAKWVQSQLKQVEVQLSRVQKNSGAQADQLMTDMIDQLNAALRRHQQELNVHFDQQANRLVTLESRIDLFRNESRKWLESSTRLQEFIYSHYNLDAQMANQMEFSRQRLDIAIDQFNRDMVESACGIGLQLYSEFSQIHAHLESLEVLRSLHYERLVNLASEVRSRVESQIRVHAMDIEGKELSDEIEVDYWTEGQYAPVINYLFRILKDISAHPAMSENEIDEITNALNELEIQSVELVTQARLAVLSSQLRFNIAQIVVQALESQGFNLEEAMFNRSDYRDAFTAKTRNLSGNEVIVTIDPSPDIDSGGELHIASTDGNQITEHELVQRNKEIFKAINDAGLDVSNIKVGTNLNTADSYPQKSESNRVRQKDQDRMEKPNHGRR